MYFSRLFIRTGLVALLVGLVTACGGGSEAPPAESLPVLSEAPSQVANSNVLPVLVDSGPAGTGYNVNRLYTRVTICESGSTTRCQTIDHVLVDTGSTGLRLLATELRSDLRLNRLTGASGFPLLNCVQFVDNTYAWGTVATADILLGDKRAASVPLQIVADAAAGTPAFACAAGGTAIATAADLGAKGIIGMGLFKDDCGSPCVNDPRNNTYYTCTDASCSASTGALASLDKQVKNPVPLFAQDNNGVMVSLPAVGLSGAVRLDGSLIFGINTRDNNRLLSNQLSNASVLTTDRTGYVTTVYGGRSFTESFFDTGSNGLYFDSAITGCNGAVNGSYFYCPAAPQTLSATIQGANGVTVPVNFSIDNAQTLFGVNTVLPTLSGNILRLGMFDWGLPFFYGRRIFFGIEGQFIQDQPRVPFYAF